MTQRDLSQASDPNLPAPPLQPITEGHTVADLPVGSAGQVTAIGGDETFRQRLLELGVIPGTTVRVVRIAPLGDPIELEVRDSRLSVRKREAATIVLASTPGAWPRPRSGTLRKGPMPDASSAPAGLQVPMQAAKSAPHYRVAIAGNPNTGKTTLFNALTGANARVGNYPGITVDRRIGRMQLPDAGEIELIDIPGTYSLNAHSREEQLAMDEMLGRAGGPPPDVRIIVLNATTLSRSLYLLLQVQEFSLPTLAVVNMADEAHARGFTVQTEALERSFGVPFATICARNKVGLDQLREKLDRLLGGKTAPPPAHWSWQPSEELSMALDQVSSIVETLPEVVTRPEHERAFALWCLMSLHEDDHFVGIPDHLRRVTYEARALLKRQGHDLAMEVVQARYGFIDQHIPDCLAATHTPTTRNLTARIDAVVTHPVAGMVIFLLVMSLVFKAIFDWAAPLMDDIDALFVGLAHTIEAWLPAGVVADLLANGLVRGVGSVVVFLPQIVILFFFLTVLEGSGYMSRTAFMMDRIMRKIGLQGRAFVPMISGYACAIPAVMATRTLTSHRDRLLTMMVIPLVSCSARLPIYTLIIGTLFPAERPVLGIFSLGTLMMLSIYVLSMVFALVAAGVLGRTVLRGKRPPLLIELPKYRFPTGRTIVLVLWRKTRVFLRTAGTVIVGISLLLWVLLSLPSDIHYSRDYANAIRSAQQRQASEQVAALRNAQRAEKLRGSYAGQLGRMIEPLIAPLGFDWKIGIGLIGSFAAREVFVATMGLVYGVGDSDEASPSLRAALRAQQHKDGRPVYTPLTGLSLLVFFMFAMQCMSTLAVVRQESRSWRWPLFMLAYLTVLAYGASLLTYQLGRLLGF